VIADYGYLNARVRGMSTRLLADELFPALVEASDLEAFAARLGESALYRRHIERVRAEKAGELDIQAVESALLAAYIEDTEKVRSISAGDPRELIDLYLSRYDVHNVRTLVRGLARLRSREEILRGTIPLGSFTRAELEELAASEDLETLTGTLMVWGLPFGDVLRQTLRDEPAGEGLLAFDVALDEAWFPWMVQRASEIPGGEDLAATLAAEVDLRNIVTLLKLARQGAEQEASMHYVIRAGRLGERLLADLAAATEVKSALDGIARTPYADAVKDVDPSSGQITDAERAVERYLTGRFAKLFRKDPLGFATILGYLWRRYAEFTDLRLIARAQAYGLPAAEVRSQMVHS